MVSQLEAPLRNQPQALAYSIEGLVQVFTSSHRSFFTNVLAQALRIAGQGTRVLIVQFLKGGIGQGVQHPTQLGQNLDWIRCDLPYCIDETNLTPEGISAVQELWHHTQTVVSQGQYTLVVLDELSVAIQLGVIAEADVITFLRDRPSQIDVILTGPAMPQAILDSADQITELRRTHRP